MLKLQQSVKVISLTLANTLERKKTAQEVLIRKF